MDKLCTRATHLRNVKLLLPLDPKRAGTQLVELVTISRGNLANFVNVTGVAT